MISHSVLKLIKSLVSTIPPLERYLSRYLDEIRTHISWIPGLYQFKLQGILAEDSILYLSSAKRGDSILWLYLLSVRFGNLLFPYLDIRVFMVWTVS